MCIHRIAQKSLKDFQIKSLQSQKWVTSKQIFFIKPVDIHFENFFSIKKLS